MTEQMGLCRCCAVDRHKCSIDFGYYLNGATKMSCRAVELIGVYLLEPDVIEDYGEPLCNPENPENALLLEMIVPYPIKECDIAAFTQPLDSPRDYWQVPYLEVFLDANGEAKLADPEIHEWHGSTIRIVF